MTEIPSTIGAGNKTARPALRSQAELASVQGGQVSQEAPARDWSFLLLGYALASGTRRVRRSGFGVLLANPRRNWLCVRTALSQANYAGPSASGSMTPPRERIDFLRLLQQAQ
jgi:hypothetical protein